MSVKIPVPLVALVAVACILVLPAFGQRDSENEGSYMERRDRAAIKDLLDKYEDAFNARDIEWRMSLCLDTYNEYGFEQGKFLQVRDYERTRREVGRYWASVSALDYSIDEVEITLDGPQAFVRAYTTHLAPNDRHSSVVYFTLVRIDGLWRIAYDSYDIVRRYD